jgi:outer membrane protein assembly factor BamB
MQALKRHFSGLLGRDTVAISWYKRNMNTQRNTRRQTVSIAWLMVAFCTGLHAEEPTADAIRKAAGIDAGLGLVIADNATLACDLAGDGKLLVHLLASRDDLLPRLRDAVQSRGLGGRVMVQVLAKDGHLPHPDRFVNLIVADLDQLAARGLRRTEFDRVLAVRGAAFLRQNGAWQAKPAPRNAKLDDWTHRFYDASGNCVSRDTVAAVPRAVQWQHGPALEDRTADGKVPRVAAGRFVTFDGLSGDLVCRDASNGLLLWRRFIGSPQNADFAIVGGQIYLYHDQQTKPVAGRRFVENGPLVSIELTTGKSTKTYDEALRAGTAGPVETEHHEDAKRFEKYNPVPWFIVRDDVIVQAYGSELLVLDRVSGQRRFTKTLDAAHTWFSPVLTGNLLLAAETVGTARRGRHDGATHVRAVTAFDLADGKTKWRNEDAHPLRAVKDSKRGTFTARAEFKPLSVADGLVLIHASSYQFRHGGRVAVLNASDGRELWHRDFQAKELYTQGSQRAIFRGGEVVVLDGLGAFRFDARSGAAIGDPVTLPKGVKRQARNNGACTASRATVDWLICNAYLYVGPNGDVAGCFGARGACGQGVVPANGLMYVNPTPCDCGDYTRGYEAMSSQLPGKPIANTDRLVRGPAFDEPRRWTLALPETGWPIFLGDAGRRSCSTEPLPEELTLRWQQQIVKPRRDALDADRRQSERYLGALSAPVAAAGRVVVAAPESHEVMACEAVSGKLLWTFQAAGKVDSPPTIVLDSGSTDGLAIFGCDDGNVYALRLGDGQLVWKFTAAPTDGGAMLHGHLASAMPLPGSVLVVGDTVFVAAGQHTDLGGLHFFALDAATGAVRASRVITADQPAVVTNDVLVADAAGGVWLGNGRSMLHLSATLEDLSVEKTKIGTAANRPALAFDRQGSRIRFRTDIGRGGSTHGWKGAMQTSFISAHRIASDDDIAYALRDPTANDRHPVRADQTPAVVSVKGGSEKRQLWAMSIGALGSRESYSALIKSSDRLYVGGGSRDGSAGFLQILDARTGKLLSTQEMPSRVTECGLAAADGRMFVCCEGGELICLDRAK